MERVASLATALYARGQPGMQVIYDSPRTGKETTSAVDRTWQAPLHLDYSRAG